jgi:hypothetical protein
VLGGGGLSLPTTTREGSMRSFMAVPSRRNSGLATTVAFGSTAGATTSSEVPGKDGAARHDGQGPGTAINVVAHDEESQFSRAGGRNVDPELTFVCSGPLRLRVCVVD